jgi:hypothetical protein
MRPLAFASFALGVLAACAAAAPAPVPPAALPTLPAPDASAIPVVDADASMDASADSAADAVAALDASPAVGTPDAAPASSSACNEQPPQDFLIRSNFLKEKDGNARAIQWRTDHYGWFRGFGRPGPDAQPPSASVIDTTFMGLPIRMHRKVVPALKCVEEDIKRTCTDHPYTARALSGIRFKNTYHGGEVTNHIFGIAIDIDPGLNPCCGCLPPWSDAPSCKRRLASEYQRMAMPECWVHVFERYGFYWLGHDTLRDTMHYEFLGDPDHIVKGS